MRKHIGFFAGALSLAFFLCHCASKPSLVEMGWPPTLVDWSFKKSTRGLASVDATSSSSDSTEEDSGTLDTSFEGLWMLHDLECPTGSRVLDEDKRVLESPETFFQFVFSKDEVAVRIKAPKYGTDLTKICELEGRMKFAIQGDTIVSVQDLGNLIRCPGEPEHSDDSKTMAEGIRLKIRTNSKGSNELLFVMPENSVPFCTNKKAGSAVFRRVPMG